MERLVLIFVVFEVFNIVGYEFVSFKRVLLDVSLGLMEWLIDGCIN